MINWFHDTCYVICIMCVCMSYVCEPATQSPWGHSLFSGPLDNRVGSAHSPFATQNRNKGLVSPLLQITNTHTQTLEALLSLGLLGTRRHKIILLIGSHSFTRNRLVFCLCFRVKWCYDYMFRLNRLELHDDELGPVRWWLIVMMINIIRFVFGVNLESDV